MGERERALEIIREAVGLQKRQVLNSQKRFVVLTMMYLMKGTILRNLQP
jgi:hypothetical protein